MALKTGNEKSLPQWARRELHNLRHRIRELEGELTTAGTGLVEILNYGTSLEPIARYPEKKTTVRFVLLPEWRPPLKIDVRLDVDDSGPYIHVNSSEVLALRLSGSNTLDLSMTGPAGRMFNLREYLARYCVDEEITHDE